MLERRKQEEGDRDTKTRVTIPYVKGVSKAFSHSVATTMKPHLTPKRMLVHPKDKRTPQENAGVVYRSLVRITLVYTLVRLREDTE